MRTVLTWPVGRDPHDAQAARRPPALPPAAYVTGCTVGGACAAGAVAIAASALRGTGAVPAAVLLCAAVVATAVAVIAEWRGALHPAFERRAQVPRHWLLWRRRSQTAFAFGLMIGAGVFTRVVRATAYVVVACIVVAPSAMTGAAVGAIYGGTRGSVLLATWAADRRGYARPLWQRAAAGCITHRRLAVIAVLAFSVVLVQFFGTS